MAIAETLLDLYTDEVGELTISAGGDLRVARDEDVVAQECQWRLKTTRGDWELEPECGADLELLIGLPNSPETGAQMEAQITRALTHDGYLAGELESVIAVPLSREQLGAIITIQYGDEPIVVGTTLDMREGLLS